MEVLQLPLTAIDVPSNSIDACVFPRFGGYCLSCPARRVYADYILPRVLLIPVRHAGQHYKRLFLSKRKMTVPSSSEA
jgi:hypothetical protein